MKNKYIDIEDEFNDYLNALSENKIYVGESEPTQSLTKVMKFEEWDTQIESKSFKSNSIDFLCLDDGICKRSTGEIFKYLSKIYDLMRHSAKLILTFKDLDFILNLPKHLNDKDHIDYIQRYIFYADKSINEIFLTKSFKDKTELVIQDKLNKEIGLYSAGILQEILQAAGFKIVSTQKGRKYHKEKANRFTSWVEELEYTTITAIKYDAAFDKQIYIVEKDIDSIKEQGGVRDFTLQNLCQKTKFDYKFIYLDEDISEEIYELCHKKGINCNNVSSIYHLATNIKPYPITYTLHEFLKHFSMTEDKYNKESFEGYIILKLKNNTICKLLLTDRGYIKSAEIYVDNILVNRLKFTYTLVSEERFLYEDGKVLSKEKLFFNENGSAAYKYEQIGDRYTFYLKNIKLYSKEEFYKYVLTQEIKNNTVFMCGENEYKILPDIEKKDMLKKPENLESRILATSKIIKKGKVLLCDTNVLVLPLYMEENMKYKENADILTYMFDESYNVLSSNSF